MGKGQKIALGIGIAIILSLFTGFFAWQLADTQKQSCLEKKVFNAYCCSPGPLPLSPTREFYGYWVSNNTECLGTITDKTNCEPATYYDNECDDEFTKIFGMVAVIIGLLAVIAGIFIKTNNTMGGGLIGGGIIDFIIGLVSYWDWLEGWIRVLLAGIVLIGLILLAKYKFKD